MTIPFRNQALIALGTFAVIAIIGAVVALFPFTPRFRPADLVPADRTIVFMENIQPEIAEALGPGIPALAALPDSRGSTAALVTLDDGSSAWIVFDVSNLPQPAIRTTDERARLLLIERGTGSLSADADFSSLARTAEGPEPWIFVRSDKTSVILPAAFPSPRKPLAFTLQPDGMSIAWVKENARYRLLVAGPKNIFPHTVFSLQVHDLRGFGEMLGSLLQGERSLAYRSILFKRLTDVFGQDISPSYDFLPLLQNQTELTLGRMTASGGLMMVLEGRSDSAKDILATLHDGLRSNLTTVARVQRTFDEKFTTDNLRIAGDAVTDSTEERGGWTVRSTSDGPSDRGRAGNRGLHSAVSGVRFIISNSKEALLKALSVPPQPPADRTIAHGSLDPTPFSQLLDSYLPGEHLLPAFLPDSFVRWSLAVEGDLAVLRLSR